MCSVACVLVNSRMARGVGNCLLVQYWGPDRWIEIWI
jgi:hypothetical protein